MIFKAICTRERVRDYLYNLEAMTRKEAKHLWRQSIKQAWSNCCAYCGEPPIDDKSLTVDHVKPKAKGGEDRTSNCVPACKRCNHSKGSEDWLVWFSRQSFYNEKAVRRIKVWIEEGLVVDEELNVVDMTKNLPNSGDVYDISRYPNAECA
jgi:hypothetical protein